MYGTVARMRVKPGALEAIQDMEQRKPRGFIRTLVFQMDREPNEFMLVVLFESKEAYFANAEDPKQHESFMKVMEFLEAEPEWNDGEVVFEVSA